MKTNYDAFLERVKNIDTLATLLDKITPQYDGTPWSDWFEMNYCNNCPVETGAVETQFGQRMNATFGWCELHNKCKFFPDMDHIPDPKETIKLWLLAEEDESLWDEYIKENVIG